MAWTSVKGSRISEPAHVTADEGRWVPTTRGINGISADGRWLAIYGAFTRNLDVYRLPEIEPVAKLTSKSRISGFSFSPSGDELAIASNGQVEFWSTKTWEPTRTATHFLGLPAVGMLFQPDGGALWLAKSLRQTGLFGSAGFEELLPLPNGMFPLALTADGRQLAVSVEGRRVQVWDLIAIRQELARLGLDW